jgi:hypothetical protein
MITKTAKATSAHHATLSVSCCHFRMSHISWTLAPGKVPDAERLQRFTLRPIWVEHWFANARAEVTSAS